jgi:hypothetical protein
MTEAQMNEAAANRAAGRVTGDAPVEELAPDEMPYRDAKALRDEIAAARGQYGPVAKMLEGLPPAQAEAVVAFLPAHGLAAADPALTEDVVYLQANYTSLDPGDQDIVKAILAEAGTNPVGTADSLRRAAELLRGGGDEADYAETGDDGSDDADRPLTAADVQAQAALQHEANAILSQGRELGYIPDAPDTDVVAQARWSLLIETAKRLPDGDLARADEIVKGYEQGLIDQYVEGKRPDGLRPQPPAGGAPASGERRLESLDEMNAAAAERVRNLQRGR